MEQMTIYIKENNKYTKSRTITDAGEIYERLAQSLIAKKIHCCKWIKSIKRVNLYNGFQRITITEINGLKTEYIIKN